jgi:hypothetical protein
MDAAHTNLPVEDWEAPPAAVATETRPDTSPMRIYLPGNECLAKVVSGTVPPTIAPTTTKPGRQPATTTTTTVPFDPTNTVVINVVDPGTTISPTDTNPFSPTNTIRIGEYWVYECAAPFPASVQTVDAG